MRFELRFMANNDTIKRVLQFAGAVCVSSMPWWEEKKNGYFYG